MLSTLLVVLPVFALILAGWLAGRMGVLGPHVTAEISHLVVYLALPALLFDVVAHARWNDVWQPGFVAAFGLSSALIFALTVAVRLRPPRHLADATIDGLNAGYANTGFVGFPLALVALGHEAAAPTLIATLITVCVLFGVAIVLIEVGLQTEKRRISIVMSVGRSLLRNPLVIAPALGALVPLARLTVPAPVESFLKLLGGAAAPCALIALGLFLAAERETAGRNAGAAAVLVGLKLIVQPDPRRRAARRAAHRDRTVHAGRTLRAGSRRDLQGRSRVDGCVNFHRFRLPCHRPVRSTPAARRDRQRLDVFPSREKAVGNRPGRR